MDDVEGEDEYGKNVDGEETEKENEREEPRQRDENVEAQAEGHEHNRKEGIEDRSGAKESENQTETLENEEQ
jgi:hypothetical protein